MRPSVFCVVSVFCVCVCVYWVLCFVLFCVVVLDWVVQVLQQVGEIGEARSIYESVIDCRTQQLGAKHADTLMAQMNLAILHKEQGEFEKARAVRTLTAHCTALYDRDQSTAPFCLTLSNRGRVME